MLRTAGRTAPARAERPPSSRGCGAARRNPTCRTSSGGRPQAWRWRCRRCRTSGSAWLEDAPPRGPHSRRTSCWEDRGSHRCHPQREQPPPQNRLPAPPWCHGHPRQRSEPRERAICRQQRLLGRASTSRRWPKMALARLPRSARPLSRRGPGLAVELGTASGSGAGCSPPTPGNDQSGTGIAAAGTARGADGPHGAPRWPGSWRAARRARRPEMLMPCTA
jgi:hypothetical protein